MIPYLCGTEKKAEEEKRRLEAEMAKLKEEADEEKMRLEAEIANLKEKKAAEEMRRLEDEIAKLKGGKRVTSGSSVCGPCVLM